MIWRPDLTVAAIVQRENQFLLVEERIQDALVFNQPAGHVEDGESVIEAAVRETFEETAWRFVPRYLLGLYLWRNPGNGQSILRVALGGDVHGHEAQRPLDEGILAAHWMTRAALLARPERLRSPLVLQCIDDQLAGKRHDLSALSYLAPQPLPVSA
jgi:8-oxo-dGTP pyrophosphatase MutT (NUDIX family)